nr:glutamine amidotransferase [uncultured Desulfobacter sp.]
MKNIFIIKTGDSIPCLVDRRGDFENWIIAGIETHHPFSGTIVPVHKKERLPDLAQIDGIIITGSHAMVTEQSDWMKKTADWLVTAVKQEIPILGICFGHQILAYALGGEVGYMPEGPEFGTVSFHMSDNAKDDPLFGGLPQTFEVQTSHFQAVIKLPLNAIPMGSTAKDPYSSFRYGRCAWGVQFHPEYDADITRAYIKEINEELKKSCEKTPQNPVFCHDTVQGQIILSRFAALSQKMLNQD